WTTVQGSASMTVTGTALPSGSNTCVIPILRPRMPSMVMFVSNSLLLSEGQPVTASHGVGITYNSVQRLPLRSIIACEPHGCVQHCRPPASTLQRRREVGSQHSLCSTGIVCLISGTQQHKHLWR